MIDDDIEETRGPRAVVGVEGRDAALEDGPACSGVVYQDAERPGPLDQSMVRPQLLQQDR